MTSYREFTITFRTDDYVCRDGHGLSLDDVIDELSTIDPEELEEQRVDFVVWEGDRVLAVVRIAAGEAGEPCVTRFDRLPVAC